MRAMILAAGLGTRMKPLTNDMPKPMLEVGNKPLIVWHIETLKKAGITDIVINLAWKGARIRDYLGNGQHLNVNIAYSDEEQEGPLETAGGIYKALPLLGDKPFIVVNGDIWCQYPCHPLELAQSDLAHLILVNNPEHHPEGDFHLKNKRVSDTGTPQYTFSGIGYYQPALFQSLPEKKYRLAPLLRQAMKSNRVSGEYYSGNWQDIGTPERLKILNHELSQHA